MHGWSHLGRPTTWCVRSRAFLELVEDALIPARVADEAGAGEPERQRRAF